MSIRDDLTPDGVLIYEADLVEPRDLPAGVRAYGIPATRIAEQLKRRMVANIVMVGFFAAVTDLIGVDAVRMSVLASVPAGTETVNQEAFEAGYKFGVDLTAKSTPTAAP